MAHLLAVLLSLPALVSAYSWTFDNTPTQCGNLSISVSGSGGQPPYSVLIIPFGASPLPNNIEARRIVNQPFPGSSSTVSFQLQYPENSQFVAVVSDASGFGSGGTSVAAQVTSSSDSTCFNSTVNVSPAFTYSIDPPNQIVQCQPTRLWWDPSTVQGTPAFLGVIPGGESFAVPNGTTSTVADEGVGFSWTPSVRGGTTLLLIGGDDRGVGSGGSVLNTVSSGTDNNSTCLTDASPSSTPGSPAGGSYPTNASGGSTGGSGGGGSSTNVGAIVGGVIGGLVFLSALALLLLFFYRRKRLQKSQKERPVDLLQDENDEHPANRTELPSYYTPEPFVVPDPTRSSYNSTTDLPSERRPLSGALSSTSRSGTPDVASTSQGTRKSAVLPRMRPVNVIQHDDAGPSAREDAEESEEPETVELPPAYTNLRK